MTSTLTFSSLEALRTASKRAVHISSLRAFILPGLRKVITATPAPTCKPMWPGSLALGFTTSIWARPLPLRSLNGLGTEIIAYALYSRRPWKRSGQDIVECRQVRSLRWRARRAEDLEPEEFHKRPECAEVLRGAGFAVRAHRRWRP